MYVMRCLVYAISMPVLRSSVCRRSPPRCRTLHFGQVSGFVRSTCILVAVGTGVGRSGTFQFHRYWERIGEEGGTKVLPGSSHVPDTARNPRGYLLLVVFMCNWLTSFAVLWPPGALRSRTWWSVPGLPHRTQAGNHISAESRVTQTNLTSPLSGPAVPRDSVVGRSTS